MNIVLENVQQIGIALENSIGLSEEITTHLKNECKDLQSLINTHLPKDIYPKIRYNRISDAIRSDDKTDRETMESRIRKALSEEVPGQDIPEETLKSIVLIAEQKNEIRKVLDAWESEFSEVIKPASLPLIDAANQIDRNLADAQMLRNFASFLKRELKNTELDWHTLCERRKEYSSEDAGYLEGLADDVDENENETDTFDSLLYWYIRKRGMRIQDLHVRGKTAWSRMSNNPQKQKYRDDIICAAFLLKLPLFQAMRLLNACGQPFLPYTITRDRVICTCFCDGLYDLDKVNERLARRNQELLPTKKSN